MNCPKWYPLDPGNQMWVLQRNVVRDNNLGTMRLSPLGAWWWSRGIIVGRIIITGGGSGWYIVVQLWMPSKEIIMSLLGNHIHFIIQFIFHNSLPENHDRKSHCPFGVNSVGCSEIKVGTPFVLVSMIRLKYLPFSMARLQRLEKGYMLSRGSYISSSSTHPSTTHSSWHRSTKTGRATHAILLLPASVNITSLSQTLSRISSGISHLLARCSLMEG